MRLQSVRHKHLRHRMSSCAHRDYWEAEFVGLFSIALNQPASTNSGAIHFAAARSLANAQTASE